MESMIATPGARVFPRVAGDRPSEKGPVRGEIVKINNRKQKVEGKPVRS